MGSKLAWMSFIGFLMIMIGVTGKLGSLLGAVIDPANMVDSQPPGSGSAGGSTGGEGKPAASGTLTPAQIGVYARQVGFSGQSLVIAIAIALAESGGSVGAINTANSNGTTDRGLWQINSVHSQYNATKLFDPAYNARAAWEISSGGTNWFPWTTYTNGRYQKFLNEAQAAVQPQQIGAF